MYKRITHPLNGQSVDVHSRQGKEIIRNYITHLQGGAKLNQLQKELRKLKKKEKNLINQIRQIQLGGMHHLDATSAADLATFRQQMKKSHQEAKDLIHADEDFDRDEWNFANTTLDSIEWFFEIAAQDAEDGLDTGEFHVAKRTYNENLLKFKKWAEPLFDHEAGVYRDDPGDNVKDRRRYATTLQSLNDKQHDEYARLFGDGDGESEPSKICGASCAIMGGGGLLRN